MQEQNDGLTPQVLRVIACELEKAQVLGINVTRDMARQLLPIFRAISLQESRLVAAK